MEYFVTVKIPHRVRDRAVQFARGWAYMFLVDNNVPGPMIVLEEVKGDRVKFRVFAYSKPIRKRARYASDYGTVEVLVE